MGRSDLDHRNALMGGAKDRMRRAMASLLPLAWVGSVLAGISPGSPDAVPWAQAPHVEPDYRDLIIPPNIAPLNFTIKEPGRAFCVRLSGATGRPIEIETRKPTVQIPEAAWHQLLDQNRGGELRVDVQARTDVGGWQPFVTITNRIAREAIDPILIYRKIRPVHSTWRVMGLYQRDLRTFTERPILENRRFANDCCHCHSLRNNDPNAATIDIRSTHYENSLLVITNGVAEAFRGTVGFVAWHPKGEIVACSFSKPRLMFHAARNVMLDIAELEGWLGYFRLGSNVVRRIPGLSDETRLLAFPTWSPDGRHLYYGNAPNPWTDMAKVTAASHTVARYDLMRVAYDLEHDQWGSPEMVLAASRTGFSVAQPRISPDARWLYFCAIAYGCWPTYDPGSDLYGIDLEAARISGAFNFRKLELNSAECESWLSWSSNSRWVVFSSKRVSPLFNRPHLAYVSASGECGKAFILPQRDPALYDSLLKTYTMPTLAVGPVTIPQWKLVETIKHPGPRSFLIPGSKPDPKTGSYAEGH